MSLIECPECRKEISDKAEYCPNCGCPNSEFTRKSITRTDYDKQQVFDIIKTYSHPRRDIENIIKLVSDMLDVEVSIAKYIAKECLEEVEKEAKEKEKYWCRKCYKQNEVGESVCKFCGYELTPQRSYYNFDSGEKNEINHNVSTVIKKFNGIYRYTLLGEKQEVYCLRCGSENCSYYAEQTPYQTIVPAKTKTRYTANLNPLKPFTLVNKKEKVVRKEKIETEIRTVQKIICNDCGFTFQ